MSQERFGSWSGFRKICAVQLGEQLSARKYRAGCTAGSLGADMSAPGGPNASSSIDSNRGIVRCPGRRKGRRSHECPFSDQDKRRVARCGKKRRLVLFFTSEISSEYQYLLMTQLMLLPLLLLCSPYCSCEEEKDNRRIANAALAPAPADNLQMRNYTREAR